MLYLETPKNAEMKATFFNPSFFLLAFFLPLAANCQSLDRRDEKPYEIVFDQVINCDGCSLRLSDYRSKVVVIDFWATWCAPCLKSFPHLSDLQSKFKNDLFVLTVTDEEEDRVRWFLQKNVLNLPIILDQSKTLAKSFPHSSIPFTIILDREGRLIARTHPAKITDDVVRKILDGKVVAIDVDNSKEYFDPSVPLAGNDEESYSVTVTPYKEGALSASYLDGSGIFSGRRILLVNVPLKNLYKIAYGYRESRTIVEVADYSPFETNDKRNTRCFELIVPDSLGPRRFEIMQSQLQILFDYDVKFEFRPCNVKVLSAGRNLTIQRALTRTEQFVQYGGTGLSMRSAKLDNVAEFLENRLGIPVINEIENESLFDLDLPWYPDDPNKIHEDLQKLGLELREDIRPVKLLIIADKKR